MNTYKLTYPDSPCVHTFQTGEELGPFCERTFGSIEAMIARGVIIDHPDFNATFTAIHPDLPPFLQKAILHYVDVLETEWLERELGILKE